MLVVCNGMLRSGSTIQYNLARLLVTDAGRGRAEGHLPDDGFALATPRLERWMADDRIHVVKVHGLHPLVEERAGSPEVRVLYVYRDLRQVGASLKRKWGIGREELLERLDRIVSIDRTIRVLPGTLCQRYEDVTGDAPTAASEVNSFLGLGLSLDDLVRAAAECSAPAAGRITKRMLRSPSIRLQLWSRRLRGAGDVYDPVTLLHPDHLSGAGELWEEVLDPWEADAVTERFRWWLADLGYLHHPMSIDESRPMRDGGAS